MRKRRWIIGSIIGGILLYGLIEPYWQKKRYYNVCNMKIPEAFDGFEIVFLADIHYGRTIRKRKLEKMVEQINATYPDLILLGGDYINKAKYIEPCFEGLAKLKATYGVYAVHGNHDVHESLVRTQSAMKRANIHSINNDSVWIYKGDKIKVGGVGDLWTEEQYIDKTLHDTTKRDYTILVTHNPKYVYEIEGENIDLILAGHTHGGQCTPLKHLEKVVPHKVNRAIGLQYLTGHKQNKQQDVIVSNGIGTAKFAWRIFARPEIVFIKLCRKGNRASAH